MTYKCRKKKCIYNASGYCSYGFAWLMCKLAERNKRRGGD